MSKLLSTNNQNERPQPPTKAEQLQQDSLDRLRTLTSHPSDRSVLQDQADAVKRLSHEAEAVA